MVVRHGQRLAGKQAARTAQRREPRLERTKKYTRAVFLQLWSPEPVLGVVDETAEVDIKMSAQVMQQMERTYLVAFVRRVGNTVAEKQERLTARFLTGVRCLLFPR